MTGGGGGAEPADPTAAVDAAGLHTADHLGVALARTHEWFEVNSGWAPPDEETLTDWAAEGMGRAPDECAVAVRGVCAHGLVSWQVVLDALAVDDRSHHPTTPPG